MNSAIITQEHIISEVLSPTADDIEKMVSFFTEQIASLYDRGLLSQEEHDSYLDWHTQEEFTKKILDTTRFFRILKDGNWAIIGYMESKRHNDHKDIQVVQWMLIKQEYRWQWLSKILRKEFYDWCKAQHYTSTWTYVHNNNIESQAAHARLGEQMTRIGEKTLFVLEFDKINFSL